MQVLLLLNYFISFYVIFHNISQNLLVLREQLSLIREEDIHSMHDAVYTKYTMFRYWCVSSLFIFLWSVAQELHDIISVEYHNFIFWPFQFLLCVFCSIQEVPRCNANSSSCGNHGLNLFSFETAWVSIIDTYTNWSFSML